jgi:hypothetical protein
MCEMGILTLIPVIKGLGVGISTIDPDMVGDIPV